MAVVENERGFRSVGQKKPSVLEGVRGTLLFHRDSTDTKARGRANGLLGELAMASPSGTEEPGGGVRVLPGRGERRPAGRAGRPGRADGARPVLPVVRPGPASPEYVDPSFEELRRTSARDRTFKTLTMYQDAADSVRGPVRQLPGRPVLVAGPATDAREAADDRAVPERRDRQGTQAGGRVPEDGAGGRELTGDSQVRMKAEG